MSLDYRLIHIASVVSIGALLLTGNTELGFSMFAFHVDFGITCAIILAVYCSVLVSKHKVRLLDPLKRSFKAQLKEAVAVLNKYTLGTPYASEVKSQMGRHNVLAAYASLMLVFSFFPLGIGGTAMLFLQRGTLIYEEMKFLHLSGVGLVALFFVFHIFAVFNVENRPLLRAMFSNGKVPLDWARSHLSEYMGKLESRD
ncbi:MAG: cytochrome b/b6 domain-containing protein [Nitrososphaerales archaeon]